MSTDAAVRQQRLEKEVSQYELDHSRNILSLTARADSVQSQFKELDDKITKVNHTMTPVIDELRRKASAKERTQTTVSLIQIYSSFYQTGKSRDLDKLMNGNIKDKKTCAATVAQLLSLSQKLISDDLGRSEQCHDLIQKYSETMENWLLEEFSEQYKTDSFSAMRDIADILSGFNQGVGVIKNFVNQHSYFINADAPENAPLDETIWEKLSDPTNQELLHDSFCSDFLSEVKNVIHDETVVILDVFREPVTVLQLFVQRVYAQQIQNRVEALFKDSYTISTLAYLRTLYSLYVSIGNFTKDLKNFFQAALVSFESKVEELFSLMDQSFSDLFTQHLAESKYFELEKKTLESIFYGETSRYEHMNEGKITNKLSARIGNNKSSSAMSTHDSEYENLQRRSRVGQLKSFMRNTLDRSSSFKRNSTLSDASDDGHLTPDHSTELSLPKGEKLLKCTVESLSRIIELTPNKVSEHAMEILEILLVNIGKSYVDLGLEVSFSELSHLDYRSDYFNFSFLSNIKISSQILFLVSSSIRTIILPLANNTPQVRQRIIKLTNGYVVGVEQRINIILSDTLSLCQQKITNSLSKQKKKDFQPKTSELVDSDTPACESLCQFLDDTHAQFEEHLDGENLRSVLLEIGLFVFDQLFEHYKNFQMNSMGGVVATKDIISYQTTIEKWKIPELSTKFQLLREIANLFTVQPELLNSLTKEGQLMRVKPYILRQFISKRTDYNTNTNYFDRLRGMI